jgi:hypothetical protein
MTATLSVQTIGKTDVHVGDIDHPSMVEIVKSLQDFYRDFPHFAPLLSRVRIGTTADDEFPADTASQAFTQPLPSRFSARPPYEIALNPATYGHGGRRELLREVHHGFESGWQHYSEPRFVFEHELGHVIDLGLTWQHNYPHSYASRQITSMWDALSVSGYALQAGPAETFADAFANVRAGLPAGNARIEEIVNRVLDEARHA